MARTAGQRSPSGKWDRLKRAIDRLLDMIETGDNGREVRERQAELGSAEMERDALAQHHLVTTIKLGDADLRRVLKTIAR